MTLSILDRLKSQLPARWFAESSPNADAILGGLADSIEWGHDLYLYAKAQTRIATATEFNLDLIAWDYLGGRLRRRNSQSDDSFRAAVMKEILRPRASRSAMSLALLDLTGVEPIIFEPTNPIDTGAYNVNRNGWSVAGRYGSLLHPFECWIDVQRPLGQGIPGVDGYGGDAGGLGGDNSGDGTGRLEWASKSLVTGPVTDDDIYATVEATRPAATIAWTRISDSLPPASLQPSYSFLLDPEGNRIVTDDGSALIIDGPLE